jgi:TolB protein
VINVFKSYILLFLSCLFSLNVNAELTIEITKGTEAAVPIAIVPFSWVGSSPRPPVDLVEIIKSDLSRSGYFNVLDEQKMLAKPTQAAKVRFRNWQALGQDYLTIGQVRDEGGRFKINFQLFDIYKSEQLMGYHMTVTARELRASAHHISNVIYEKLTGIKGVFNTKIAYVTSFRGNNRQKTYKLQLADADGFNPKTIMSSREPLMSPAWSPDGKKIAYVSFEKKSSAIYVQTLATGKRTRVSDSRGINGAPAWSPDGSKLALTLSKDGSPDIFVLNLSNRSLLKITKNYAIDTEPSWSPDGKNIVFTSDRGGKAQLYLVASSGGRARRLTFDGDYNARGSFSQDGKHLTMVHANRGDYRIAIMDMETRSIDVLTQGRLDESPSFSPNGRMILYSTRVGKRNALAAVSADGSMHQRLEFDRGEVREPAWSP